MTRWINDFENHQFQGVWKNIKSMTQKLSIDDKTISSDIDELARFKKVITYIDELLEACDPELIPKGTWDNFYGQANNCFNQLNSYNSNRDVGNIKNANNNLDNLLSYVRPFVVNSKTSARAAGLAFKSYSKAISSELTLIKDQINDLREDTEINFNRSEESYKNIEAISTKVEDFNSYLFKGIDGDISLETQFANLHKEVNNWNTEIHGYYNDLLVDDEASDSIKREVNIVKEDILSTHEEIYNRLEETKVKISELKNFYIHIFGSINEETDEVEGGLKQELRIRQEALDDFKLKQETKYKVLVKKIEGLLPGATSAGLASGYRVLRRYFTKPIKNSTKLFYCSIFILCIVSFISIVSEFGWFYIKFIKIDGLEAFINNTLHKLPIILPVIWLAYYASKRRAEADRLQQEYAHKEVLAKSYESFKKQIEDLNTEDKEMMSKLLGISIDAIGYNASETLDKKNGDKFPLHELSEEFMSKIVKLVKEVK